MYIAGTLFYDAAYMILKYFMALSLCLALGTHSVFAAIACGEFLVSSDGVINVRDLPVKWISAEGANIQGAAQYEKQQRDLGFEPDPAVLEQILGGAKVHLRLTQFPNGLRYVTIHEPDGRQSFEDYAYAGLLKDLPSDADPTVAAGYAGAPPQVKNADLGDGFKLMRTFSSAGGRHAYTLTEANKRYLLGHENAEVEFRYSASPYSPSTALRSLLINYRFILKEDRTREVRGPDGTLSTITEKIPAESVIVEWRFLQGNLHECKILVMFNSSHDARNAQWEEASFHFDLGGRLTGIVGISRSKGFNPHWTEPDLLRAVRKGEGQVFRYAPTSPEAAIIFRTVFGREISSLEGISFNSVNHLFGAAAQGTAVNLPELLQFR